jgi:regulator of protease activity HflC (stomatin/prohibitin superfamily)
MAWIVVTVLLVVVAFASRFGMRVFDRRVKSATASESRVQPEWKTGRKIAKVVMIGALTLIALETFLFSFRTVSTKNVGIVTQFGATSGHLSNGAHLVWPWESVTEMDAAIQTDSYTDNGTCLSVRIGNQQTACVSVSIRWRINEAYADQLFQNYRTFEHVRDSLVTRELTAAVNQQFAAYNPLNSVATTNPGDKRNPPLNVIAGHVTTQMKREIGNQGIEVLSTIIPLVTFDTQTQNRINQLQQQFALTRIAEQERLTNIAQAKANKALAASVNSSPNVLVAQCLTILGEMVKQEQTVPAGFSCWPGGSRVAVIAGAGK